jgi:hypothetical protein
MKVLGPSVVIGVVLALLIIYWLRPLNAGAVGLVIVLSIGIVSLLGQLLAWLFGIGQKKKGNSE